MTCLRNWNHLNFYQGNERFSVEIVTINLKVLMIFCFFLLFWLIVLYLSEKKILHFGTVITIRCPGPVIASPQLLTHRQVY